MPPRPQKPDATHTDAAAAAQRYRRQVEAELGVARQTEQAVRDTASHLRGVAELVSELPKRLTAPIMVPFGKHAFFPGQLQHTNEVTMNIGCGYYIECTAAHAAEVLDRRVQALERSAAHASQHAQSLQARLHLADQELGAGPTSSSGGGDSTPGLVHEGGEEVVEIRETLEESDALLRSAAAGAISGGGSSSGTVSGKAEALDKDDREAGPDSLDEVFKRIAELERLEQEAEQAEVLQQQQQQQTVSAQPRQGEAVIGAGEASGGSASEQLLPEELFTPISLDEVRRSKPAAPATGHDASQGPASHAGSRQPRPMPVAQAAAATKAGAEALRQGSSCALPSLSSSGGAATVQPSASSQAKPVAFKKGFLNATPAKAPSCMPGSQGGGRGRGAAALDAAGPAASAVAAETAAGSASDGPMQQSHPGSNGSGAVPRRQAFTGQVVEREASVGEVDGETSVASAGLTGAAAAGASLIIAGSSNSSQAASDNASAGLAEGGVPAKRVSKFKQQMQGQKATHS